MIRALSTSMKVKRRPAFGALSFKSTMQIALVFVALALQTNIASAKETDRSETLQEIVSECFRFLLTRESGEAFAGGTFIGMSFGGAPSLRVQEERVQLWLEGESVFDGDAKCFLTSERLEAEQFGLFAAGFVSGMEKLGLKRIKPFTATNFTFFGCTDSFVGDRVLKASSIYRKKSKVLSFSAESDRHSIDACSGE